MNRCTYNITDDRLKFWPAERLSPSDYAEAKACKFQWYPGQKCFSAIWRPQAVDFLARLGVEIEDVCEIDDVAARVERFDRYANNAEETAAAAAERLENGRANTARRQRLAEGVAAREFGSAAHWQSRIAGAIRHAQQKENPGAIMRRIETLETELRRHERGQKPNAHHYADPSKLPELIEWHRRFAEHIGHRLEYERARLAATGHTLALIASNEIQIEKGGALKLNRRRVCAEGWYYITKTNPRTVEVYSPNEEQWRGHFIQVPRDEISEVASVAQVESGEVPCHRPPVVEKVKAPPVLSRDGKRPELFGSFGASGGFVDRLADCTWFLITKVNRSSVEYLAKQRIQRADRTQYWQYYIKKTEISGLSFVKTPAETKAAHPDLLQDWADVEAIRARREAAKAAQPQAEAV